MGFLWYNPPVRSLASRFPDKRPEPSDRILKSGRPRMTVQMITDSQQKPKIAREILEALPDWFGVTESREKYILESGNFGNKKTTTRMI